MYLYQNQEDLTLTLNQLDWLSSSSTTLISLYLPGNQNIEEVKTFLRQELSESSNIKSKETKNNVQYALKTILRNIKDDHKLPLNGIAIFVGYTRENGMVTYFIEAPFKLTKKIYICSKHFETEILKQEISDSNGISIGFIIIDGNSCYFYIVTGPVEKLIFKKFVDLDSDTSRGGQSQARHARNRDIQKENYLKLCSEGIRKAYEKQKIIISSIFVAGNGDAKYQFSKYYNLLGVQLENIVHTNLLTIKESGGLGLREALKNSEKLLDMTKMKNESIELQKLMYTIDNQPDKVRLGEKAVMEAINEELVETLYITDKPITFDINSIKTIHYISGRTKESIFFKNIQEFAAILYYNSHILDDEIY